VWTQAGANLYPTTLASNVGIGTATVKAGFALQVNGQSVYVGPFASVSLLETVAGTGWRWALANNGNLFLQSTTDGFTTADNALVVSGATVFIPGLAGTGTRMVVATNLGGLTTQAIPAGTVTDVTGTLPIVSSGGTAPAISINAATTTTPGSMSSADKTKLDGLSQVWTQAGNNLYPTTIATRVGIGNTAPDSKLQVSTDATGTGTDKTAIRATVGNNYGAAFEGYLESGVAGGAIISTLNGSTTPVERLRIVGSTGAVSITNLTGAGTRMVVADANGLLSSTGIPTGTVTNVSSSGTAATNPITVATGTTTPVLGFSISGLAALP
jgi:hypothetical protein